MTTQMTAKAGEALARVLPNPATEPTLTVDRVAALFHVSRQAVYDKVNDGSLPSVRFGRAIRIPTASVLRLLDAA